MTAKETAVSRSACIQSLPEELIELIIDYLVSCSVHPRASRAEPCLNWHTESKIQDVARARLISKDFCNRLNSVVFEHICCRGQGRQGSLVAISQSQLAPLVRTLRIDIAPRDFGREWSNEVHGYPVRERPLAYFDDLKAFLVPVLSHLPDIRTLHLTTTYNGLHLGGTSRGSLLFPCFKTLCQIIKDAQLSQLEEIQIGVPYEGGYAGFFKEPVHKELLESISENLRTASVKLSDWQDNFTLMPIF